MPRATLLPALGRCDRTRFLFTRVEGVVLILPTRQPAFLIFLFAVVSSLPTTLGTTQNLSGGLASSFKIVPIACDCEIVAPEAPLRSTANVSSGSSTVSPWTATTTASPPRQGRSG